MSSKFVKNKIHPSTKTVLTTRELIQFDINDNFSYKSYNIYYYSDNQWLSLLQGCHSLSQKIFPERPETSLSFFQILKTLKN